MLNKETSKIVDRWSNSFLRPFVPPKLMSNSKVKSTEDDGAKLVYIKFLYGVQTGTYAYRPFDGSSGNVIRDLKEESLWIYSLNNEVVPEGFTAKKYDGGVIRTGEVKKCGTCRGHGRVRCQTCKGKIRWTSTNIAGERYDHVCSCGDGKQLCNTCNGFSDVELVINVKKQYKVHETKNSQYSGEVPEWKIRKSTGELIYEIIYDYPLDILREMLLGGINKEEYRSLNGQVLKALKRGVEVELANRDVDLEKIYAQLDSVFETLDGLQGNNKVLEYESMPVRVLLKVENSPVKQIDYTFKEKDYSIWIYGKSNSIWKRKAPFTFNYKAITLSIILLTCITLPFILQSNQGTYSSNNSRPSATPARQSSNESERSENANIEQSEAGSTYTVYESFSEGKKETMTRTFENGTISWFYSSENGVSNLKLSVDEADGIEFVHFYSDPETVYDIHFRDCGFTLVTHTSLQSFNQVDPECN